MRTSASLFVLLCVGTILACSSPQERKAEAEAQLAEQKAAAVKEYRDCLRKYEGQKTETDPCARYKEAAETLAK